MRCGKSQGSGEVSTEASGIWQVPGLWSQVPSDKQAFLSLKTHQQTVAHWIVISWLPAAVEHCVLWTIVHDSIITNLILDPDLISKSRVHE